MDHQLRVALAGFITMQGHGAEHVRDLGLMETDDAVIWQRATAHDLAGVSGGKGRLVWVRIGNCRKQVLLQAFGAQLPRIVSELEGGSQIVELR